jgi:hypothetical protein
MAFLLLYEKILEDKKNNQVTLDTSREICRLQVFEYRELREIFNRSRNEVRGRKLHNGEFHNLYSPLNITRRSRSVAVAKINSHRFWVGTPEEKRPLGIPSSKWEDNIKCTLKK